MILFRCDSVYQLMNAIQIKMTLLKDESADLLLSDHTNFDPLIPALQESGIFEEVKRLYSKKKSDEYWTYTKEERKNTWRELEKKYLPHKNYEGCDFLEKGTWWFKQGHIFKNPFYYIDYTLAQICSLQFWKKIREDKENGWNDYLNICKVGGTKSFLEIVKIGNLISPFEDGCVESVIGTIENWIDNVDDKSL